MFDLIWDVRQDAAIRAAHTATARAEGNAERLRTQVHFLADRVDRLSMICAAMWSMLQTQSGLTDDQLAERIQELDMTDGKLDGKVRRTLSACAKCGRGTSLRHARCMYCGEARAHAQPFDQVL